MNVIIIPKQLENLIFRYSSVVKGNVIQFAVKRIPNSSVATHPTKIEVLKVGFSEIGMIDYGVAIKHTIDIDFGDIVINNSDNVHPLAGIETMIFCSN